MPLRKRDTARALGLLEDYCSKLKKPEEQQLKAAVLRVMGIFRSSLFQALIVKNKKHPVNGSIVGGNRLLMRETRGEWQDWVQTH
ncbi:hypothetical protein AMELA_G00146460 [Ameiurus melas]|uniref:L27-1 domain-containing protein n=1 Tax=Ameiurus melas TaxID=219545 RepID=A0A7J6AGC8_AMEME|nr:hypothetical protein AMELA_G00146460 [Ameiurus melas]